MQGAEERRLRRMEQYAARRSDRRQRRADDALMVDQGESKIIDRGLKADYNFGNRGRL